jgi:hypothetical protein
MRSFIFLFLCFVLLTAACAAQKQPPAAENDQKQLRVEDVVGDWQGESKCVGHNPSCHDETSLYHFSALEDQPNKVHLAGDKLVNGKWELMGTFELDLDPVNATMTAEFPIPRTGGKGVLTFKVAGDKMDGVMTVYPENEIARKIHLERQK